MAHEYTVYDFKESVDRVSGLGRPKRVLYAYGESPEGGGSWNGGFVFENDAGKIAILTGWCDYTGWGCQDGATGQVFDNLDGLKAWVAAAHEVPDLGSMDADPQDLNKWISDGMEQDRVWEFDK